jgi:hypothetical protein
MNAEALDGLRGRNDAMRPAPINLARGCGAGRPVNSYFLGLLRFRAAIEARAFPDIRTSASA